MDIKEEHDRSMSNCIGMSQMLYYEKAMSAPARLLMDFYLKTINLLALEELTKDISGNYDEFVVDNTQYCDTAIAEQKL